MMICVKLLIVTLSFTVLLKTHCQAKDGDGAEDVDAVHWVCEDDSFDDPWGEEKWISIKGSCGYSGTPAPFLPDFEFFPDISCIPGFSKRSLYDYHKDCESSVPDAFPKDPDANFFDFEQCYKSCVLRAFLMDFDWVSYDELTRSYSFNGFLLYMMVGKEVGEPLMRKIQTQCNATMNLVMNEKMYPCDSPEANELYDCVDKAIGC